MSVYLKEKREFFDSQQTKPIAFRKEMLKQLKDSIKFYEDEVLEALRLDLNKPEFEAYTSELALVYQEINMMIEHLDEWAETETLSTPVYLQPAESKVYHQPLGVIFIIAPWNYPFQLVMVPLIGALAAGNCAVLKPSNKTPHVALVIEKIISETFNKNYVSTLLGPGSEVVNQTLENNQFDHIFFTGSQKVGKIIMKQAAEHLTPTTLELGGKSPAIVMKDADLKNAAKRIMWGKFYNAGQTCVAVDHVLVHESVYQDFVAESLKILKRFYGEDNNENLATIIDDHAFMRLKSYLEQGEVIHHLGSDQESKLFKPALIKVDDLNQSIMKDEIFGPILPIITYKNDEDLYQVLKLNPNPLALYVYTENMARAEKVIMDIPFGGGAINHNIVQFINNELPFGGFKESGMGHYHGRYSFECFSHKKSIVVGSKLDVNVMYPPYNKIKMGIAKKLMK